MADGRIKILHLMTGLDSGGAFVNLFRLTKAMDRTRFENVVVSRTNEGPMAELIRSQCNRVHAVQMSSNLPTLAALWRLYRLIRNESPEILQTWLYHSDLCGLLADWAARVPAIVWKIRCSDMGEAFSHGFNGFLVNLLALLSPRPDAVVANSHAGKDEHQRCGYHPRQWAVIENGFDLSVFAPHADAGSDLRRELGLPERAILFGLVARYDPINEHETFLRGAAALSAKDDDAHFVLVGDGMDDANAVLTGLLQTLNIRQRVHLLGRREDIPQITAGLDIATCCSLGEGFPTVVGETMACAVPCVVTDVGDAGRIVGNTGLVVPPSDPQALAHGLH